MSMKDSEHGRSKSVRSKDVRASSAAGRAVDAGGQPLDATDRAILAVLAADGRIANNALAEQVGIAASTCLTRVRALRESGVIRGVHADIDPAAVGLPLQAMIAVRVQAGSRDHLMDFAERIRRRPEVRSLYF
ncbi:MAG: Lrp/AsnC family transcriptional regulator, partial [Actinomycetota bacterium]|nr:Lrp/AsnC family transcriptional regulator [Actinomycetota bacterium]